MTNTVKTAPAKPAPSTVDTGRVHVGGGMIRYATTTRLDAGQVKNFSRVQNVTGTSDAGRVHVGGGMMRF